LKKKLLINKKYFKRIMENENNKEELSQKETETLDKIIDKLLSVKKYLYISFNNKLL
jgi:hypothetical protein